MNKHSASSSERERVGGTGEPGSGSVAGGSEWGEDESSDRAREKRLEERIKKWENDERSFLADELPALQSTSPPSDDPRSGSSSSSSSTSSVDGKDGSASQENFFRSSVVVPSRRSVEDEKISRMNRRREINELTVRMALSSVGGTLPPLEVSSFEGALGHPEADGTQPAEETDLAKMWDALGCVVVVWSVVEQVADRALGSVLIAQQQYELQSQHQSKSREVPRLTLDPPAVPWNTIARAFLTKSSTSATKRHWAKENVKVGEGVGGREGKADKVIEGVKESTDLNDYEGKLLGCIVDSRESNVIWRPHPVG